VATTDRYEAIMEVALSEARGERRGSGKKRAHEKENKASRVPVERRAAGDRSGETARPRFGYLAELLPLAAWTGRRLSAILQLRYDDLRLSDGPYGAIRWRADTDKGGRESVVPLAPEARKAIDRALACRPGIGPIPLFPSPRDPSRSVSRFTANGWLRKAERAAKLEHLEGTTWHAYRRLFATARKHLPEADVMQAAGWKDSRSFKLYQQHDAETLQRVVEGAAQIKEAR
jgi:integrase